MRLSDFHDKDGKKLDRGLCLSFPAPNSFTGEDMVEFHAHGNPLIAESLIEATLAHGARVASAGEFSRRAYLNGKLDLAQAESIADLINSSTQSSMRAALRSLSGDFSARINSLREKIMQLRVYIEASLDFPTEEIDLLQDKECARRTKEIITELEEVLHQALQGSLLTNEMQLAIIGKPNAGKSSMLNWICRNERAIVNQEPGTTRDFLQEAVDIQGMRVVLTDTAGIRTTPSELEQAGIERSWQQAQASDLILFIYDASVKSRKGGDMVLQEIAKRGLLPKTLVIANKIDLLNPQQVRDLKKQDVNIDPGPADVSDLKKQDVNIDPGPADAPKLKPVAISTKQNKGMRQLVEAIAAKCGKEQSSPTFSARARHVESLQKVLAAVRKGNQELQQNGAGELFAEDLKLANSFLDEILGETTSEDLLDRIFADFCIGK